MHSPEPCLRVILIHSLEQNPWVLRFPIKSHLPVMVDSRFCFDMSFSCGKISIQLCAIALICICICLWYTYGILCVNGLCICFHFCACAQLNMCIYLLYNIGSIDRNSSRASQSNQASDFQYSERLCFKISMWIVYEE